MCDDIWMGISAKAEIVLSTEQCAQLEHFLALLSQANKTMNLTRIADGDDSRLLHVADALTLLSHIQGDAQRLADVGSGGGVPGIPLAIARPDLLVTLIESTQKKARYLGGVIEELELKNVKVNARRAEDVARGDQRERFCVVTCRAVGILPLVCEWCLPLARVGGRVLAMKGPRVRDELAEAQRVASKMGGSAIAVYAADLPGQQDHLIVRVDKIRRTPAKFPRHPSNAKGKPLS